MRGRLSKELKLPGDRMELWIAPPPSKADGGGVGSGVTAEHGVGGGPVTEPVDPLGERAAFDDMSLGHYGLGHGGAVDVRLRPPSKEKADAVYAATAAVAAARPTDHVAAAAAIAAADAAAAAAAKDIVRAALKTNGMMLRGEDGVVRPAFHPLLLLVARLAVVVWRAWTGRVALVSRPSNKPLVWRHQRLTTRAPGDHDGLQGMLTVCHFSPTATTFTLESVFELCTDYSNRQG